MPQPATGFPSCGRRADWFPHPPGCCSAGISARRGGIQRVARGHGSVPAPRWMVLKLHHTPLSRRCAMTVRHLFSRVGILTLACAAIAVNFLVYTRPWLLQWGATTTEIERTLPGDEIIPTAASQYTRAVTIQAPADQ